MSGFFLCGSHESVHEMCLDEVITKCEKHYYYLTSRYNNKQEEKSSMLLCGRCLIQFSAVQL